MDIGYDSSEHVVFMLVKSTHMRHLLDNFRTNNMLANQDGYLNSIMKPTFRRLWTSSSMVTCFSSPTLRFFYDIGLIMGSMARGWPTTLVSILIMWEGARENKLTFLFNRATNSSFSTSDIKVPIFVTWESKSPIWTSFMSFMIMIL